MGNSSTKEQRPQLSPLHSPAETTRHPRSRSTSSGGGGAGGGGAGPSHGHSADPLPSSVYSSRHGRSSRADLPFRSAGGHADREPVSVEIRRETKQEREARRAERERLAREKERERSMREESVDGGYLVTQGVYTGSEDFNKWVVRQLMIERRLAPFFKGLNDYSDAWTDEELVAAVKGQPLSTAAASAAQGVPGPMSTPTTDSSSAQRSANGLTLAISSRSPSFNAEHSPGLSPSHPAFSPSSPSSSSFSSYVTPAPALAPAASSTPSIFRPRSKTLASLTTLSKNPSPGELMPQEIHLPRSLTLDGRPLEAVLYKDASECPICFLYYPVYLNRTRCCDQPICSECFVQIKRPDPHLPEHVDPTSSATGSSGGVREEDREALISEPAACPFCVQPELGVTYEPPPFRSGLAYANQLSAHSLAHATSAMSSSSSLSSFSGPSSGSLLPPSAANRRRTTSLSATSPAVITTDRIRPDWAQKLATARANAARRSAAATALHTAAYLMSGISGGEGRSLAGFGRRNRLLRGAGAEGPVITSRSQRDSETDTSASAATRAASTSHVGHEGPGASSGPFGEPASGMSRRTRLDDLEDMMMMEAIRLSLVSEEERKKREEKEAKKEAKKKGKETKRTGRATRKEPSVGSESEQVPGRSESSLSGSPSSRAEPNLSGKGKGVPRRAGTSPGSEMPGLGEASMGTDARPRSPVGLSADGFSFASEPQERGDSLPRPHAAPETWLRSERGGVGPSHPHQLSASSSPATSFIESAPGSIRNGFHGSTSSFEGPASSGTLKAGGSKSGDVTRASTPPTGGTGTEAMFNFRSLAAMIGNDDKVDEARPVEDALSGEGAVVGPNLVSPRE